MRTLSVCRGNQATRDNRSAISVIIGAIAAASFLGTAVEAGKHNRVVDIGDQAPIFEQLPATDGKKYDMSSFKDTKALAVVFTCNHCPVAKAYEDRIKQLAAHFRGKSVTLLAVNVNRGETVEAMTDHANQNEFNFIYLRDESKEFARALGAVCTPHAFLLDAERTIVYMGAIDDHWQGGDEVEQHYLRDAIEAVLKGATPQVQESKQVGCGIRW